MVYLINDWEVFFSLPRKTISSEANAFTRKLFDSNIGITDTLPEILTETLTCCFHPDCHFFSHQRNVEVVLKENPLEESYHQAIHFLMTIISVACG